jgi:hypothetical protein
MDPVTATILLLAGLGWVSHATRRRGAGDVSAFAYDSVKPGSQPSRAQAYAAAGGFDAYVRHIHQRWLERKAQLDAFWTIDLVREAVVRSADVAGLGAQARGALWGVVRHESGARPVGVYGSDPAAAIAAESTAYGVGQVTISTFQDVKHLVDWNHHDLWHPALGAITAAWVLKAKLKAHGGDLQAALDGYAGSSNGGTELAMWVDRFASEVA